MAQQPMYPAVNNSVPALVTEAVSGSDTSIVLDNAGVLPAPPNLLTLGEDDTAEVVRYGAVSGNTVSQCVRGYHGTTARAWPVGTLCGRNFTAYDHDTFMGNIGDLAAGKLDAGGDGTDLTVAFTQTAARANVATGETQATLWGKVSKWFGDLKAGAFAAFGTGTSDVARGDHRHDGVYVTAETDPNVADWARKPNAKPTYTVGEIAGAVPDTRTVNGKALSADVVLGAGDVGAATPSVRFDMTLLAAGWTGNAYSVQDARIVSATQAVDVSLSLTATEDQARAARNAQLRGSAQAIGGFTLTADGAIPAEDVPITVEVRP